MVFSLVWKLRCCHVINGNNTFLFAWGKITKPEMTMPLFVVFLCLLIALLQFKPIIFFSFDLVYNRSLIYWNPRENSMLCGSSTQQQRSWGHKTHCFSRSQKISLNYFLKFGLEKKWQHMKTDGQHSYFFWLLKCKFSKSVIEKIKEALMYALHLICHRRSVCPWQVNREL